MTAPPSLRWPTRPDDVPEELRRALTACWRDVASAGGAVGFAELLPVEDGDVRPEVDAVVAGLDAGRSRLLVAARGGELAGWLLVTGNATPVLAHRERLRIEVRGGAGLEGFYRRFGWTVVGAWPAALQIAPGDRRDEVLMGLDVRRLPVPDDERQGGCVLPHL